MSDAAKRGQAAFGKAAPGKASGKAGKQSQGQRDPLLRRQLLLELCSQRECDATDLVQALGGSRRTVAGDIAWAKAQFPDQFRSHTDSRHRRLFRFEGQPPRCLDRPLAWISGLELTAIVAARGLLRVPADGPQERATSPYPGLLDGALHRLLLRAGLEPIAKRLAPEAIQVSRFGARPEDPRVLAAVVAATVQQEGLRFEYVNRWGEARHLHAAPRRLVLIRGEFHCFMWTPRRAEEDRPRRGELARTGLGLEPAALGSGRIKQYRVSRMRRAEHTSELPAGCPVEFRQWRIDRELAEAFETTGSADPAARRLVRLAVSPEAFAHLEGRVFGGEQRWTESPPDLPPGWRRLEFFTSGIDACKYWVLGFGAGLKAERPPELVRWLRQEVARMARALDAGRGHATGPRDGPGRRGGRSGVRPGVKPEGKRGGGPEGRPGGKPDEAADSMRHIPRRQARVRGPSFG